MAYDNQQQRPAPPPIKTLTQDELEAISALTHREGYLEFPPGDIAMMYEAFPDGTKTMVLPEEYRKSDFKRFIRMASAKRLDPLLGDLMWEYRSSDKAATGMIGRPLVTQGGDLKIAHRSGLDGIDQEDKQDEGGFYVKTIVYKRGCNHPFTFKAYHKEYAKIGGFTWKDMPYLMLAKCSRVGALRIAFPEELAGLLSEDEPHNDYTNGGPAPAPIQPQPSNPALAIIEKPEVKPEVKFTAGEPTISPGVMSTSEVGRGADPAPVQAPTVPVPTTTPAAADPKQADRDAYRTRLSVICGPQSNYTKAGLTKAHVDGFANGFFNVDSKAKQPKDPAGHLAMLDDLILQLGEGQIETLKLEPVGFGAHRRRLLSRSDLDPTPPAAAPPLRAALKARFKWGDGLCQVAAAFMTKAGIDNIDELKNLVLDPANLSPMSEQQIEVALSVGYYGAAPMGALLQHYSKTKIPLSLMLAEIEKGTGAPLASWKCDPLKVATAVNLAIAANPAPAAKSVFGRSRAATSAPASSKNDQDVF